jgi:thiol-disulfide isomerase/thioredoxin
VKPAAVPDADASRRQWLQALSGAALAAAWATAGAAAPAAPRITWPPLMTVDGQPLVLTPGVPVLVVFWATWCGYCLRHNAHVDRLHRSVDATRLRVLGVAEERSAAAVQAYMRRQGYQFPVVLEEGRLRPQFTSRRTVPMTCPVDADGRPGLCIPGEMAEDDVMGLARLAAPAPR